MEQIGNLLGNIPSKKKKRGGIRNEKSYWLTEICVSILSGKDFHRLLGATKYLSTEEIKDIFGKAKSWKINPAGLFWKLLKEEVIKKNLSMVKVNVKTLFQGKIALNAKYLNEAVENKKDLSIRHDREVMTIPYKQIKSKIVGRSDNQFKDRFNKTPPYYIYYFSWIPDKIAKKLEEKLKASGQMQMF